MNNNQFWGRLWYFYKWHILFFALIAVCVAFILANVTQKYEPDLSICYMGKNYINVQVFEDNKKIIEDLLHDANEDEKKVAAIAAYPLDTELDLHEVFEKIAEKDSYEIFISEKNAFTKYENKSIFVTASEYVNLSKLGVETLKDDSGRVYAISLEKCDFMERFGIYDTSNLYIAAINPLDGGEITKKHKNGRNITQYILTEE